MTGLPDRRLDNPVHASLTGRHAAFAEIHGGARRYPASIGPFMALPDEPTDQDWLDAAELAGPGGTAALVRPEFAVPDSWKLVRQFDLVQLAAGAGIGAEDAELVVLGEPDVPDMLALTEQTEPGPFGPRTYELGRYLGLHQDDELIAMAGVRFHPPGWTEISAVCTAPDHRGRGLAKRLIRALIADIERAGDNAFLHTGATNTTAIALYQSLGFTLTRNLVVSILQPL
jgi:ribosomal protein S18 acetylase RimI-like enzyme